MDAGVNAMVDQPMKLQKADPNTIPCRDCIYRDKTTLRLNGELLRPGITKDTCMIFDGKKGNWKPNNVYFLNEDCIFYEQDPDADRFWERKKK